MHFDTEKSVRFQALFFSKDVQRKGLIANERRRIANENGDIALGRLLQIFPECEKEEIWINCLR